MRIFGSERISASCSAWAWRRRPHRARNGHEVDRARAEAGGGAELLHRKHLLEYDDVMNKQRHAVTTCGG